jgi:uncharacterized protein YbbC (DUF1343 family)
VNPGSVNSRLLPAVDLLSRDPDIKLTALFGPQHGIRGETQDNMIEWQSFRDLRTGLPAYSLYAEHRRPTEEMLSGVDVLVFDLPDVGTRVYTFIHTMALAMEAAREFSKKFIVLDRPNPIGGVRLEGSLLDSNYASFVGMYPIPMRHGMTTGELAMMFNNKFGIGCDLDVVAMEGWRRELWFDQTGLPWVMPSPNMPTLDTATVYPGAVLVEGTNLSEGRGTTRPFEIIGSPYVDPFALATEIEALGLRGALFRPVYFQPSFNKYAGQVCGGVQIHVADRGLFEPVKTGIALVSTIRRLYPEAFEWKQPPYEYEYEKLPFDVIAGGAELRKQIEGDVPVDLMAAGWSDDLDRFRDQRAGYLLY